VFRNKYLAGIIVTIRYSFRNELLAGMIVTSLPGLDRVPGADHE
jgi:hypothetical protein